MTEMFRWMAVTALADEAAALRRSMWHRHSADQREQAALLSEAENELAKHEQRLSQLISAETQGAAA